MEIIIATGNAGKVREFKRMLEPLGHQVFSQKEKGIALDVEETGTTFAENALLKAKAVWDAAGVPVIADDSGLCVDALEGRPGVYSARYAGEHATDAQRVEKLLEELVGVQDRTGRFVCAIAYIDQTGAPHIFEGVCEGTIAHVPRGEDGFGYDPIFLAGEKTFAEMSAEEKDAVSHRGKANRLLEDFLRQSKMSPYQEQRKMKPPIEQLMEKHLEEPRKTELLRFVAFLRENKMSPQWASTNSYALSCKNRRVCIIKIGEGSFQLWLNTQYDEAFNRCFAGDSPEVRQFLLDRITCCFGCGSCKPGKDIMLLDKPLKGACFNPVIRLEDPTETQLALAQRLVLLRKEAIQEGRAPKMTYIARNKR